MLELAAIATDSHTSWSLLPDSVLSSDSSSPHLRACITFGVTAQWSTLMAWITMSWYISSGLYSKPTSLVADASPSFLFHPQSTCRCLHRLSKPFLFHRIHRTIGIAPPTQKITLDHPSGYGLTLSELFLPRCARHNGD